MGFSFRSWRRLEEKEMASLRETVSDHWPKPSPPRWTDWITIVPTALIIGAIWALAIYTAFFSLLAISGKLRAHEWYPPGCCSGKDCYAIPASDVRLVADGWLVIRTNETIDKRGFSPDGQYHRCSLNGDRDARTICLFIPHPAGS